MQIFKGIEETRTFISREKNQNKRIGLVPTMGALHKGHLSLVEKSLREMHSTVVSIFVNPLQFNNSTDLNKYPRTIDQDIRQLESFDRVSVFAPTPDSMYQQMPTLSLNFGNLDKVLEGKFRPGHFSGVGIVVSKLFNIIQPDAAYFGQKDYQQFLIIKQVVNDLNFSVQLTCGEIVREENGLAMSSRNQRLSAEQRNNAANLFKMLHATKNSLSKKKMSTLKMEAEKLLLKSSVKLEYLELANRDNLQILDEYNPSIPSILLIAAYVGDVRLIDNLFV